MNTLTDTTTTELLPLFQEWAEMEPDRCRISHPNGFINIEVKLDGRWEPIWSIHLSGLTASSKAIVQSALQKAIVAHGWHWEINDAGAVHLSDQFHRELAAHRTVNQLSIALLQCYLQALRAARAVA